MGAALPLAVSRAGILLLLLAVPDLATGYVLGFHVAWSEGLTLSNFVLPAVGVPLLGGAWLAGRPVFPRRWPGMAKGYMALLVWGALTLAPWLAQGQLTADGVSTLLAHVAKLALFLTLAVALVPEEEKEKRWLAAAMLVGMAANAAWGLSQAGGWSAVFSPLAQLAGGRVRVTGMFYDANMYAILCAWALLWLLCRATAVAPGRGWAALGSVAVGANLVLTASRAGYIALLVGAVVLLIERKGQAVAWGTLLALLALVAFPQRSLGRVQAAVATTAGQAHDAGTQERVASMRQAWLQIKAHPLLGVGFGRALYLGVPAIQVREEAGPVRLRR
ncbi:MAG: O-antigen ligase family protein, partial [Chloroflexota bacterium]